MAVQAVHESRLPELAGKLAARAAREADRITGYAIWRALRDLMPADRLRPLLQDREAGIRRAALLALIDTAQMPAAELVWKPAGR